MDFVSITAIRTTIVQLLLFSKYDLYTKSAKVPDVDSLKPYYQGLIDKFCPGVLEF